MQSNQVCSYKYCYYNVAKSLTQAQKDMIQHIFCPLCKNVTYCSSQCRERDLQQFSFMVSINHKTNCQSSVPKKLSINGLELNDTASTLKSIRRSHEDFEVIQKDNKADLGRGSYGCVKLVRDKQNGQLFAMKIMNKKQIFEFCTVENLKREIKIQRKLQHPHVTKLFHYFEDKENVYLILEYAENGSLFNYLRKRRKLPENEAFVYFYQTCLGIDYLHKKLIIHRDLKPENLLLDKQGNIKLCDFGWSAETASQNHKRNTFCGTIDYMAPEMLLNQPHDYTLDIWCLGILLFELIHGFAPFKGKNDNEKIQNITKNVPIQYDASLSSDCKNLIRDILKYNPRERMRMDRIFEHPWMKTQAKFYQIDIQQYIYKEQNDPEKLRENMAISPQTEPLQAAPVKQYTSMHNGHDQKQNIKQYLSPDVKLTGLSKSQNVPGIGKNYKDDNYLQEDHKNRVSRVSMRNHQAQEMRELGGKDTQETGFMDRMFMALGCLNRDKPQPK